MPNAISMKLNCDTCDERHEANFRSAQVVHYNDAWFDHMEFHCSGPSCHGIIVVFNLCFSLDDFQALGIRVHREPVAEVPVQIRHLFGECFGVAPGYCPELDHRRRRSFMLWLLHNS